MNGREMTMSQFLLRAFARPLAESTRSDGDGVAGLPQQQGAAAPQSSSESSTISSRIAFSILDAPSRRLVRNSQYNRVAPVHELLEVHRLAHVAIAPKP